MTKNSKKVLVGVREILNGTARLDHVQVDASTPDQPVHRYHIVVQCKNGRKKAFTVGAEELANQNAMVTMFMRRAGLSFDGSDRAAKAIRKMLVEGDVPQVRQLSRHGYDERSGWYFFNGFAFDLQGRMVQAEDGRVRMGRYPMADQIRPFQGKNPPCIMPKEGKTTPRQQWELVQNAWGERGLVAYAFMVASWFVRKVKPDLQFFPFLSLYGDTQTGKSRLTRTLCAMQCLNDEGLPMAKVNTGKGEIRTISQRSGLFQALLEGNGKDERKDKVKILDAILPLYNEGNPLQTRAASNNGNDTVTLEFFCSLVFVQNTEPFTQRAEMERVVSVKFTQNELNDDTTRAFNELTRIEPSEFAATFKAFMGQREAIEADWRQEHDKATTELLEAINDRRIAENHGIILAFHRLVEKVLGVQHDLKPYIVEIAKAKVRQANDDYETPAEYFLDRLFKVIATRPEKLDEWYRENQREGWFAFHFNEAYEAVSAYLKDMGATKALPGMKEIQTSLKTHDNHIESGKDCRVKINGKAMAAWKMRIPVTPKE